MDNNFTNISSEFFNYAYNRLKVGVALISGNGQLLMLNDELCSILGFANEDLEGKYIDEIIFSEDKKSKKSFLKQFDFNGSEIINIEQAFVHSNGSLIWLRVNANLITDKSGQTAGVLLTFDDITEQKKDLQAIETILNFNKNIGTLLFEEVMQHGLDAALKLTDSKSGFFYFVNESEKTLNASVWATITEEKTTFTKTEETFIFNEIELWQDVFISKVPIIVNDCSYTLENKIGNNIKGVIKRQIIVPVIENNVLVAILGILNKPTAFTEYDLDLIMMLVENFWHIIKRKQAESELIASEEKNKAFSLATNEAIFFSEKGFCIESNQVATEMFGYTHDEFLGMFATDIIAPEYVDLVKKNIFSNNNEPYEGLALRKDGSVFWAEFQGRMAPFKGKEIRVSTIRDITNRKILEDKRKASEYSYQTLFANMNEAFALHKITLDDKGVACDYIFLDVNPVFEKLTGLKKAEIIGKNAKSVMSKVDTYWIEKFGNVALKGESIQFTNFDSELNKYFESKAYCPEYGYFAVTFTDITDKIKADKEISLHNERLECLVRISQAQVSNYIDLIKKIIEEAVVLIKGNFGAFYFYNTNTNKYELIISNKVPGISKNIEKSMPKVFKQALDSKRAQIYAKSYLDKNIELQGQPLQSLICIPVLVKGAISIVFGIGSSNLVYADTDKKHLMLLVDSVLQIIEKQKYQDQILTEKLKAEINESRFFEIQKAGKIGWYEALIKEGLFLGSYETYNIFFDEYYNYPVKNEHLVAALHPDDKEMFFNTVQQSIEKKLSEFEWEYRVITKKSGVKHVYSKAFLKFDKHGNLTRRFGIVQDITDKKKIELELVRHNDRLESLFRMAQLTETSASELLEKALDEALHLTSSKIGFIFRYGTKNKEFKLEAYTKKIINNKSINTLIELGKNSNQDFLHQLIDDGKIYIKKIDEQENKTFIKAIKEGNELDNFMLVPITISSDEKLCIAVLNKGEIYNTTDAKQLTLLMDSIWKVVERQNYQEQLVKEKERAEESDKLKSAFLANMSHEIRTPMNGIIGFSELFLQDDISTEKRQSYASIVIESGKQLLSIVDDILDISKIEVGQVVISKQNVSVNDIITELFSFYSPRAKDNNLNLFPYKDLPDNDAIIYTDKQRLLQILNNLLSNAFKFTHKGEISYGYMLKNDFLEFYVKDTGSGIPKSMQNAVFERFIQAEPQTIKSFRGTGLGLSISQKLIELLGGKIWLESVEGKGTTFYFTLPYKKSNEAGDIITPEIIKNNTQSITILIAEDEEINFLYLSEVLRAFKIKILHAASGIEAVEMCKKHAEINLVLMDIKLPEMDGLLATEKIRLFKPHLPIIAQTAFAMESDKEKVYLAGCTDYIAKPLNKENLLTVLKKYIEIAR